MPRVVSLALVLVLAVPASGAAQTIVLRPDASLASSADAIVAGLGRRTQRAVAVDGVLEDPTPRDLGGVIGLARIGDRLRMFAAAPSRALHVTEVGAGPDERTTARVLVVALSAFVESLEADVARPDETAPAPIFETYELPIDGSALEDLARPYREQSFALGFVMELRDRVSYATQRDYGSNAGGASVGVCFGTWWCLVLDVDVMAPEESHALGGSALSYFATAIGIGGRFLPLEAGPVRGGLGVDLLGRVGSVRVVPGAGADPSVAASDLTFSAGARLLADVAVRMGGPVSLAIEGGADVALNAYQYRRAGAVVLGADVVTLWAAIALRIGPF
jgi:hypothetical protein